MSSDEKNLISKILLERDMSAVTDAGVKRQFFADNDARDAFEMITEHLVKYSQVPTVETFKKDYPTFRLRDAADSIQYYIDTVVSNHQSRILEEGLMEATDLFEEGFHDDSKMVVARTLSRLNEEIAGSRVTDLTQTSLKRMERYKAYRTNDGSLKGISTGFTSIDNVTGGLQKKQLVVFVGPPKAGKTTIMLLSDMAAHKAYYRPLFIGFEMSNEEQEERHDAIRARVSHKKLRDGTLSKAEYEQIEKMMKRMEMAPPMIFSEDANSTLTISGVAAQIERYDPDVVFIDGVYMMEDENGERKGSPQALTNITRGLKQMAKNKDLPVCISTQVLEWKMDRKKGVTSGSIGYSSSFIQDADNVIAVQNTDDDDIKLLKVVMGRNNPGMEIYVRWDWSTGEFVELEEGEYGQNAEEDEAEAKF